MLHLRRIRLAPSDFLNNVAGRHQRGAHLLRLVEPEIDRHRLPPPLLQRHDRVADMEGQQQQAAGHQHATQLGQRGDEVGRRNVDNRVERGNARPGPVRLVEGQHIALTKGDVGVQRRGLSEHPRRQIHADYL